MPSPKVHRNFINGSWVAAESGETFENVNPADTTDVIGAFARSGEKDVRRAVAAAGDALDGWRRMPAPRRAEILFRASSLLQERKEEFAKDMTREMGKVLKETRGDVQEAIDTGFYAAGEGRRMYGETVPAELPDKFAMSVRAPLGICGMITPWNFPMAIPSWKIFPALICGNTVVIKPATDTPLSVLNFARTLTDAGVPPGVVNVVTGTGGSAGAPMLRDPDIRLISFTGSTEVGRTIAVECAQTYKRCSLEMGGKNAMILLEDADLGLAVEAALWGAFGTTGQRCTATSRVIAQKKVAGEFAERMAERARALKIGNGLDESVEMGPCVNEAQRRTVASYVEIGVKEKARLLTGGNVCRGGAFDKGWFHEPTIFMDVRRDMRIAREEIFGPVLSILPVEDLDEAIEVANDVEYGLSGAIFTRDVNAAFRAMRDVDVGIFYVNSSTIGAEVQLPFGGMKRTGNGHREAGSQVLDIFSEWKSVYIDFSGRLQKAQIDRAE